MQTYFPELVLLPALFYTWQIGIRFELGTNWFRTMSYEGSPYLQGVYKRAIGLFEAAHAAEDELFIVTDIHDFGHLASNRKKLVMTKYFKDKNLRYRLTHHEMPYLIPEDNEDGSSKTHRFILTCRRGELNYRGLLKEACNEDMGFKRNVYQEMYIVNKTKQTVFHVYDDRGCDLIAASAETIRPIYESHNDWILDYDRKEIDQVFNGGKKMKPVMNKSELTSPDDIWNAVIAAISEKDFPSGNEKIDEAFIAFQYYSEMESGAHESLLHWTAEYIEEMGIKNYLQQLTTVLKKIGADDYAAIENKYGENLWRLFKELEEDELKEEEFYEAIEKADGEYHGLDGKLEKLLAAYFVDIHTDLIEVVENQTNRQEKVKVSFAKAVKANGKAIDILNRN